MYIFLAKANPLILEYVIILNLRCFHLFLQNHALQMECSMETSVLYYKTITETKDAALLTLQPHG